MDSSSVYSLLKRCGPLLDMVRVAQNSVKVGTVLGLVIMLASMLILAVTSNAAIIWLSLALGFIGSMISYRGLTMIFSDSDEKQDLCLYLRSFRTDKESMTLRSWLKAALGASFRLSGIKPPMERTLKLLTILYPALTGIRYVGSSQFQLEAPDRNWMARLLASFQQTRFVFIDARDVTPHVREEIRLAWLVFGSSRILFIVDDSRSTFVARSMILDLVDDAVCDPAKLQLLVWPTGSRHPDKADFAAAMSIFVAQLPVGSAIVNEEALAFVRARVGDESWKSRLYERETPLVVTATVASGALAFVPAEFSGAALSLVGSGLGILFWLYAFRAWLNARKQSRLNHEINPAKASPKSRVWKAFWCLMVLPVVAGVAALAALAVPVFASVQDKAIQMIAANQARQVIITLKMYASYDGGNYPDAIEGLVVSSANDAFRALFQANVIDVESIFGPARSSDPQPDGNIGEPPVYEQALEAGENVWALTADQTDSSASDMPLVYTSPARASWPPAWSPPTSKGELGEAMAGNVIVVGRNDGSVQIERLVPELGTGLLVPEDAASWTAHGEQRVLRALPR